MPDDLSPTLAAQLRLYDAQKGHPDRQRALFVSALHALTDSDASIRTWAVYGDRGFDPGPEYLPEGYVRAGLWTAQADPDAAAVFWTCNVKAAPESSSDALQDIRRAAEALDLDLADQANLLSPLGRIGEELQSAFAGGDAGAAKAGLTRAAGWLLAIVWQMEALEAAEATGAEEE